MAEVIFSVSQINEYLSRKLWRDPFLGNISVVGEVTNFKIASKGIAFFSLKDEDCLIDCVMHDCAENEGGCIIEDGALIKAAGKITIYRKNGSVRLAVQSVSLQGAGDLFVRFELTRKKLEQEGIFDLAHKKQIPDFSLRLGVVTSADGAVLHDIVVVSTRRFEGVRVIVYPVKVQGPSAAREVCEGIEYFNKKGGVDVLIVGRGGGSFEDLSAFNEECVARAVYSSEIPVVSAVGHETDYSLCDMAADLRAPTPSAAAEMTVPEKAALIEYLRERKTELKQSLLSVISEYESKTIRLKSEVKAYSFELRLKRTSERIKSLSDSMRTYIISMIQSYLLRLEKYEASLKSLDPRSVLERGYALVYGEGGNVISSNKKAESEMLIEFTDGLVAVKRKE